MRTRLIGTRQEVLFEELQELEGQPYVTGNTRKKMCRLALPAGEEMANRICEVTGTPETKRWDFGLLIL